MPSRPKLEEEPLMGLPHIYRTNNSRDPAHRGAARIIWGFGILSVYIDFGRN